MGLFPPPTEAGAVYTVQYVTGRSDWGLYDWDDDSETQEMSPIKTLMAAMQSLKLAQWEGYDDRQNAAYRQEVRADLREEFGLLFPQFNEFIAGVQNEPISDTGYWWEF